MTCQFFFKRDNPSFVMFCTSFQLGRHTNLLKNNNADMKSFLIKEGQVLNSKKEQHIKRGKNGGGARAETRVA